MWELALLPALVGTAAALFPKGKPNDRKTIDKIYRNVGYALPPKSKGGEPEYPRYKKKLSIMNEEQQIGTRYLYTLPLGLSATVITKLEETMHYFKDGLQRPVLIQFRRVTEDEKDSNYDPKKYMIVSVFNKDIPRLVPYGEIPSNKDEWVVPLGKTLEDIVWINFEHIPHMTIAGVTRFGKTVFLKVLMTYLIENHPDDVEFYIIDLKGGLEFGPYEAIRQVKGVAGDYMNAFVMAYHLHQLLHQDLAFCKSRGKKKLVDCGVKRRRFIIVDEAAQLAAEKFMSAKLKDILPKELYDVLPAHMKDKSQKDLMNYTQYLLSEIARMGGALSYNLIYCTQYPTADTLPRQIKMNSDAKLTYRLPTGYASEVAIDAKGAEELPSNIKGRALYKTHDLTEMQTPLLEDDDMWKRLEKYQIPRLREGETRNGTNTFDGETGGNSQYTGPPALRNEGTAANHPQIRHEP